MNKSKDRQTSRAPGHAANDGQVTAPEQDERYQTAREHTQVDQERQSAGFPSDGSAGNHAADQEREERIRRRAYELWEEGGRQDGQAEDYWHRAAQDLDREDAELPRSGSAGKGVAQN